MGFKTVDTYEVWKYQRKLQFINFCYGCYVIGTSLSIYLQTEYFYFKDVMKTDNPSMYYGLSSACLCASGAVCSILVSYYGDRTKNVRGISITISVINIIGNILYVLYYSPFIVLFGQFLAGTTAARNVSITAEISRVYKRNQMSFKTAIIVIFATLGALSGPCLTFAFKPIHIHVGNWKIMIGNMPGFHMCLLSIFQLFLDYFILNNVSNNLDTLPPEEMIKTGLPNPKRNVESIGEYLRRIKCLLSNRSMSGIYVLTVVVYYSRGTMILLQAVKFSEFLTWNQVDLAIFHIIVLVAAALPSAILVTILTKYVNDFYLLLYSFFAIIISVILLIFLARFHNATLSSYILAYGHGLILSVNQIPFNVVTRSMLVKFAPDNMRTIADSIRNMLFEVSLLLAGLTIKLHQLYLTYTLSFLLLLIICCTLWILFHHHKYRNIEIIDTDDVEEEIELLKN